MVRRVVLPTPRCPNTPMRCGRHSRSSNRAADPDVSHINFFLGSCENNPVPLVIRPAGLDINVTSQCPEIPRVVIRGPPISPQGHGGFLMRRILSFACLLIFLSPSLV